MRLNRKRGKPVMAVMVPSFFAPILTRHIDPDPGPAERNMSSRLICIFTGRPAFFDNIIAMASWYTAVLPPKAPPTSVGMTFRLASFICIMRATDSRSGKCPWVVLQSVDCPFSM